MILLFAQHLCRSNPGWGGLVSSVLVSPPKPPAMGTKPHTATEEQLEDTLCGARKEVTGPGVHNPLFLET